MAKEKEEKRNPTEEEIAEVEAFTEFVLKERAEAGGGKYIDKLKELKVVGDSKTEQERTEAEYYEELARKHNGK